VIAIIKPAAILLNVSTSAKPRTKPRTTDTFTRAVPISTSKNANDVQITNM
jgi:hypothetical protein